MPSLIGTNIAANYRKTGFGSKFSTRELVLAKITVDVDLTDFQTTVDQQYNSVQQPTAQTGTSNGLFTQLVQAVQTMGEIYAIGEPSFDSEAGDSVVTIILAADTLADDNFQQASDVGAVDNGNSSNLETVINDAVTGVTTVNVDFEYLYGLTSAA